MKILIILLSFMAALTVLILYSALVASSDADDVIKEDLSNDELSKICRKLEKKAQSESRKQERDKKYQAEHFWKQ